MNASPAASTTGSLKFENAFAVQREPARLHFRASSVSGDETHEVEVWREGDARLKRLTDHKIETLVFKPARDDEWHMVVLDLPRRIRTDITRTNLARIGHFTDWFAMAHALKRPDGSYRLMSVAHPLSGDRPLAACRWVRLVRSDEQSDICWSASLAIPLLVTDRSGKTRWKVVQFDTSPFRSDVFAIDDAGFARNDANQDIQSD